jgi:thymidylate kinase
MELTTGDVLTDSPVPSSGTATRNGSVVLSLVKTLCRALEDEGIVYCHWKSNEALDRSASGDNDLDLLVRRADFGRFIGLLYRLGFKEARPPSVRELPGVLHYYGLDVPSGRLVHVHTQAQLLLGDDTTKNYRLPMEDAYLASAVQGPLFATPDPAYELAVFVVRMVLKHATWDAIGYGRGRLGNTEQRELAWLRERADPAEVARIARDHMPYIDQALWEDCGRTLDPDASVRSRIDTARRLRAVLAAHARYSPAQDTYLRVWRRAAWGTRRYVFQSRTRKKLIGGGAIVGVVGGDGAGKSSAVGALNAMLSRTFVTTQVHLGKPRRSMTTLAVKGSMYVGRQFGLFPSTRIPAWATAEGADTEPTYAWLLWHVLNARDRHREYTRARRFAGNGGLVICDRYPLPELAYMDGARTRGIPNPRGLPRPARMLVDLERRYYERITYPDALVVLRLDPEIAVSRRHDEEEDFVRRRNQEVWERDWSATPALVVDAAQPQNQVLEEILSHVWARL